MTAGFAIAAVFALAGALPGGQVVPAARIAAAVEDALRAELPADARVQVIGATRDQMLPPGALSIAVGKVGGRWPRARVVVPVRLEVDGRAIRTMSVAAEISAPRQVLTYDAAYAARTGGSVRLVSAIVDMTCCAGEPIADGEAVAGLRLRRAVQAGMPAMQDDFEPVPDVGAHTAVRIVVTHGATRITTPGVALADGRIGDRIPVRTHHSNAPLQARVVAPQEVAIDD